MRTAPRFPHDHVPRSLRRRWVAEGRCPDRTLAALWHEQLSADPAAPAVVTTGAVIDRATLDRRARRLAAGLRACGIGPGDVVVLALPTGLEHVAADLAIQLAGAVSCPLPARRGARELCDVLADTAARAAIVPERIGDTEVAALIAGARLALPRLDLLAVDGAGEPPRHAERLADVAGDPAALPAGGVPGDPDAGCRLLVSSGSEGAPKLVLYSANALAGGRGAYVRGLLRGDPTAIRAQFLVPLASAFGSAGVPVVLCTLGGSLAVHGEPFEPRRALAVLDATRATHLFAVPAMLRALATEVMRGEPRPAALRIALGGGSHLDGATLRWCRGQLGIPIVNVYGSADGVNCHTAVDDDPEIAGRTVGRPDPAVAEIRIVDAGGRDMPAGTAGEILARGPMSPLGCWNDPERDARIRTPGGWVRCGDRGRYDADGRLEVLGRVDDTIVRGGQNISPSAIEALARSMPAIADAACVGVDCPQLGQRVGLAVVPLTPDDAPEADALRAFLVQRHGLEPSRCPDVVRVFARLPLTPAGKIDRRAIRRDLEAAESVA